jgi:hypothetical protein
MKTLRSLVLLSILAAGFSGSLFADIVRIANLPDPTDIDTISIQLRPLNGSVSGEPGATIGWGFTVNWTSTNNDWISFTGSSLGSVATGGGETNPALNAHYVDYIGQQGGPVDFGLAPGTWTEAFDRVSQGVGAYTISNDPSVAFLGAQDTGQITFAFQVYAGDPTTADQIGDASYSYYGSSTAFSAEVTLTPEPGHLGPIVCGGAALVLLGLRRRRTAGPRASV